MKALSVKQPWASLIASGQKTIECRTWFTDYRGPLLIVSSKQPTGQGPAGQALARAFLVDCRPMERTDVTAACCDWSAGTVAFVLACIKRIKPFAVRGQLGIYDVEVPGEKP